ncbi:hypothetical protein ACLKA6_008629 [Drosophila palustris]
MSSAHHIAVQEAIAANPRAGPKPLTIEQYRARQSGQSNRRLQEDYRLTQIPKVRTPKRRGGATAKLRRERAALLDRVNADPPPTWAEATALWLKIDALEQQQQQKQRAGEQRRQQQQQRSQAVAAAAEQKQ